MCREVPAGFASAGRGAITASLSLEARRRHTQLLSSSSSSSSTAAAASKVQCAVVRSLCFIFNDLLSGPSLRSRDAEVWQFRPLLTEQVDRVSRCVGRPIGGGGAGSADAQEAQGRGSPSATNNWGQIKSDHGSRQVLVRGKKKQVLIPKIKKIQGLFGPRRLFLKSQINFH